MQFIFLRTVIVVLGFWSITMQAIAGDLYEGLPDFSKIPQSIMESSLFADAPTAHVKVLDYISTEIPPNGTYSRYQIQLLKSQGELTRYKTIEYTGANKQLFGNGVSYGGMFSMQYFKEGDLARQPNYYKKYQWYEISDVRGNLFPLHVGNKLTFKYKEYVRNKAGDKTIKDDGKMLYEVTEVIEHFKNAYTTVPGKVYVIKFSKSTNRYPYFLPQNIYYFSEHLGWYIYAKYYFSGKPLVEYQLTHWR